jgi:pimeloyl-ACP methyl ester carboxylesterase
MSVREEGDGAGGPKKTASDAKSRERVQVSARPGGADSARRAMGDVMAEIDLSAGTISYEDTGGDGPVVVLCHGLLMTASLWDAVVAELGPGFRCVRPTLPVGAHPRPMRPARRSRR